MREAAVGCALRSSGVSAAVCVCRGPGGAWRGAVGPGMSRDGPPWEGCDGSWAPRGGATASGGEGSGLAGGVELWQRQSHSHPVPAPARGASWGRGLFPDAPEPQGVRGRRGLAALPLGARLQQWRARAGREARQAGRAAGAPRRLGLPDKAQRLCVLSCAWTNSTGLDLAGGGRGLACRPSRSVPEARAQAAALGWAAGMGGREGRLARPSTWGWGSGPPRVSSGARGHGGVCLLSC